jgi:hypothetical protein
LGGFLVFKNLAVGLACLLALDSMTLGQGIVNKGKIGKIGSGNVFDDNSQLGTAGSGNVREERRGLPMFTAVVSDSVVDITVRTNPRLRQPVVVVRADDNLIPSVTTTVRNGTFYASLKRGRGVYNVTELRAVVEIPVFERVELQASGAVLLDNVHADTLTLRHRGSGNLDGSGRVEKLTADSDGTGNMSLRKLIATGCDLVHRGTGDVTIHVTGELHAETRGTGKVVCCGAPCNKGETVLVLEDSDLQIEHRRLGGVHKGQTLKVQNVQGKWLWIDEDGQTRGWLLGENVGKELN